MNLNVYIDLYTYVHLYTMLSPSLYSYVRCHSCVLDGRFWFLACVIARTTTYGIMDHEEARRKHVGGKIVGFFFWENGPIVDPSWTPGAWSKSERQWYAADSDSQMARKFCEARGKYSVWLALICDHGETSTENQTSILELAFSCCVDLVANENGRQKCFPGERKFLMTIQENNRNRFWAPEHIQYIDLRTYSIIETHFGCSKSLYQLAVLGGCFRWTFCSASFIDLWRCEARWGECWDQGPWAVSPRRVQSYRAALKWHTCHLFRVKWETWMSCGDQAFWRPLMCAWTIGDSPLRCRGCRWVSAAVSNRFSAAVMPFLQDLRHVWLRPARSSTPHCRLG